MGWNNQAVTLIVLTEAVTGFSGLFGYSPAPGPGNLILSITAVSGTDPYGNAYGRGVVAYGPGPSGPDTAQVGFVVAGGFPALGFASGASSETRSAQFFEQVLNPNTTGEQIVLDFDGPQGGGASPNDSVGMQMFSSSAASPAISTGFLLYTDTAGGQHQLADWGQHGFGGLICQTLVGAQPGTINTTLAAETWHTITSFGTGFAAGSPAPRYRYVPVGSAGMVQMDGQVAVTANTAAGATMFTLPAGYAPARVHPFITFSNTGTVAAASMEVQTSGAVQATTAAVNGDAVWLDGALFAVD